MAPKARHLNKVPLNWCKTVERLFTVAFKQSTTAYKRVSLCGWRPLSPGAQLRPLLTGNDEKNTPLSAENDPGVVIMETETGVGIEIEIPEIKEESLYLEVDGDTLIVRAECVEPNETNNAQSNDDRFLFQRLIRLPVETNPGQIQARLVGNTIRVIITKKK